MFQAVAASIPLSSAEHCAECVSFVGNTWFVGDIWLFAQEAPAVDPPTLFSPWTMFMAASLFLFYSLVLAPGKRSKAERDHFLSALKKNDRVITSGGIHGTITAAAPGEEVVTVKVDNNTRLKISRSAIATVVTETAAAKKDSSDSHPKHVTEVNDGKNARVTP